MLATATQLPFADASFDIVFSSFGALQFVSDIADAVAETARVLRPGGRFAFSITHPTRWMFPDDPGEAGLVASQSYWDRTPYVEVDDATGVVAYVEHHRTLGDWVGLLAGAGFVITRLLEPGVARGPRAGVGRLVRHAGAVHPRHRDLRLTRPTRPICTTTGGWRKSSIFELAARAPRHAASHADHLGDDRRWVQDVLQDMRADDVVESAVCKWHVRCIGHKQRPRHSDRTAARALAAVLLRIAVEQDVGPPRRLVPAAHVEDQRVVRDWDEVLRA